METISFEKDLEILKSHSEFASKCICITSVEDPCDNPEQLLSIFGWDKYGQDEPSDAFHPINSGCIRVNDLRLFGIRCNHLIWIDYTDDRDGRYKTLLIGNHKGYTDFRVITYNEKF